MSEWQQELRRLVLECTTCGWRQEGESILELADGWERHLATCKPAQADPAASDEGEAA